MPLSPAIAGKIAKLGLQEQQVYRDLDPGLLLDIFQVAENPDNPKTCTDARLLQIAQSLKQKGWIASEQPLVWRDGDKWRLINGHHRYRICSLAGFLHFPAVVAKGIDNAADATALAMALEEATARRDKGKWAANLMELAASGRDEELRGILRVRDPEALRLARNQFAGKLQQSAAGGGVARSAPKIVSLTFTGDQYAAYQQALGAAKTRLKQAQATVDMIAELADRDVVALAAVLRNAQAEAK